MGSMRKGRDWPISGGSTIGGKSGDNVWVRSTNRKRGFAATRVARPLPAAQFSAETFCLLSCLRFWRRLSSDAPCWPPSSIALAQLALQRLGVFAVPRQPVLRDLARINVLHRTLQRLNQRRGQGTRRKLWRQFQLVPLVVHRTGKEIDEADAGRVKVAAQGLRQGQCRGFGRRISAVRRIVR